MWILCRYKYIISHNILDHISILMARQYFGPLPIISVSQGHFSRTDMAASRDRDLVKMREIRNTKFEPKILSLLSNRFQVGLRENPHGKIFQNWSLDCYHKINPILDVSKRSRAKLFYFRKIPILNFLNSQWSVFRDPLSRWCVQTVDSWDQQFLSGEGRGAQRTQENTNPHKYKYEKHKYKCSADTIINNRVVSQVTRVHCSVAKTSDSPWMMGNMH